MKRSNVVTAAPPPPPSSYYATTSTQTEYIMGVKSAILRVLPKDLFPKDQEGVKKLKEVILFMGRAIEELIASVLLPARSIAAYRTSHAVIKNGPDRLDLWLREQQKIEEDLRRQVARKRAQELAEAAARGEEEAKRALAASAEKSASKKRMLEEVEASLNKAARRSKKNASAAEAARFETERLKTAERMQREATNDALKYALQGIATTATTTATTTNTTTTADATDSAAAEEATQAAAAAAAAVEEEEEEATDVVADAVLRKRMEDCHDELRQIEKLIAQTNFRPGYHVAALMRLREQVKRTMKGQRRWSKAQDRRLLSFINALPDWLSDRMRPPDLLRSVRAADKAAHEDGAAMLADCPDDHVILKASLLRDEQRYEAFKEFTAQAERLRELLAPFKSQIEQRERSEEGMRLRLKQQHADRLVSDRLAATRAAAVPITITRRDLEFSAHDLPSYTANLLQHACQKADLRLLRRKQRERLIHAQEIEQRRRAAALLRMRRIENENS